MRTLLAGYKSRISFWCLLSLECRKALSKRSGEGCVNGPRDSGKFCCRGSEVARDERPLGLDPLNKTLLGGEKWNELRVRDQLACGEEGVVRWRVMEWLVEGTIVR